MRLHTLDCIYNLMDKMEQRYSEAHYLFTVVDSLKPKRILEIGTSQGGTTALLAMTGAEVTTVDKVPVIDYAWNELWYKKNFPNTKIIKIEGDSTDSKVIKQIKGEFDFVWIDGSHQGEVRDDWNNYSKLSKTIGLHDIINKDDFTSKFWKELKEKYNHYEYFTEIETKWGGGWGYGFGGGIGIIKL